MPHQYLLLAQANPELPNGTTGADLIVYGLAILSTTAIISFVIAAILWWLFNKWFESKLNHSAIDLEKKLEARNQLTIQKLEGRQQQELESLHQELTELRNKNEVQYLNVYTKMADIIADTYAGLRENQMKLIEMHQLILSMHKNNKPADVKLDDINALWREHLETINNYKANEIYLPEMTVQIIQATSKVLMDLTDKLRNLSKLPFGEFENKSLSNQISTLQVNLEASLNMLVTDFRNLVGSDELESSIEEVQPGEGAAL